jgi:hypothetical protein
MGTFHPDRAQEADVGNKHVKIQYGKGSVNIVVDITSRDGPDAHIGVSDSGAVYTGNHRYSSLTAAQLKEAGVDLAEILALGWKVGNKKTLTDTEIAHLGGVTVQVTKYVKDNLLDQKGPPAM